MKLAFLQKTPKVTAFNLSKRMSKTRFSIYLQCRVLMLKHRSFLILQVTPPPFLFLSHRIILYPGTFTYELVAAGSSFDSVIPIMAALVLLAMDPISSLYESKLFMVICRRCKPLIAWFGYGKVYVWFFLNWP